MRADNFAKLFAGARKEYMILKFITTLKKRVLERQDAAVNEQKDRLVADILKKQNFNKGYQKADMVVRAPPAQKLKQGNRSKMQPKAASSITTSKPPSFKTSMLTSKRASAQAPAEVKNPVDTADQKNSSALGNLGSGSGTNQLNINSIKGAVLGKLGESVKSKYQDEFNNL